MKIAFRKSDGSIVQRGDDVTLTADRVIYTLYGAERHLPYAAMGNAPAQADLDVAVIADDAIVGQFARDRSHTYNAGTQQVGATAWEPVPAPAIDVWKNKQPIPPDEFPAKVSAAFGPTKYNAIRTNPKTSWIWDIVQSPGMRKIDPNDKNNQFKNILLYLKGDVPYGGVTLVSPTDDDVLIDDTLIGQLVAVW